MSPLPSTVSPSPTPALQARRRTSLPLVSGLATLAGVAAIVADLALEYTPRQSA